MKKILFMALASAVLFACQEPNQTPNNGETKSVALKIQKNATTRAALGQQIGENEFTELKSGTLFFFNATGNVVLTHALTSDEITAKECLIENVPAAAVSVAMTANQTDLSPASPATFTAFKAAVFGIDAQAEMAGGDGVTEGDNSNSVQDIALLDKLSSGAANALVAVTGQEWTHEAAITLVPAVSRIEIAEDALKVKVDNLTNLESFDFGGIYVNNYSPTFTLGFAQAAALFGATIEGGDQTAWEAASKELDPCEYLFDEPAAPVAVTTADGVGAFAYHVFPGAVPHIVLRGSNFAYTGVEAVTTDQYWIITEYRTEVDGAPLSEFLPGTVYRITSIEVGDTYPPDDPYQEPVKIRVTVEVLPWDLQDVYVTPN
jgi:hypothetical protein